MTISNTTLPMRYWCYLCQILLQHLQINVIYRLYVQQYAIPKESLAAIAHPRLLPTELNAI
ncbi:hypothetical protein [Nostoc sp. DedSLP04]|uniref:hypothetical protein n=1 Tax=Nostoc sp. DedSLP04 TaxID=3075401 RepID=UPI002AD32F8A|nr:hypothetical protein [Nostoc sp. DedSLP04]MDZ8030214.1 hypothetical protein [Nostoc sp. DedSLP04]